MAETLKKVGNYKLVKKIGTGATSEVFEGRKEGELERFAIKMIKNKTMSKQQKEMIAKEVLIIKNIHHPHIVKLHQTLETTNHYYLIFEFCQKGDLEKYLKENVGNLLALENVKKIIRCIGQAVSHLHARGIAHRDIKLANILLKRDFTIKLADFGFARESTTEEVMMKTYCGTPITMAPQILQGRPYDKKCDIWSLGVILFQLVFGKLPFPIDQGYSVFVDKVTKQKVKIPTTPKLPNSLANLLCCCLQRDQYKRYSIDEFMNSEWMTQQISPENTSEEKLDSINEILKKVSKQQSKLMHGDEEDMEKQSQCLQKLLAYRVHEILNEEISRIFNRHLNLRNQIGKLVEDSKQLRELLLYYDSQILKNLRKKQIKMRFQGLNDVFLPLVDIQSLQVPNPLSYNPTETQQAGTILLNYLKQLMINDMELQKKKNRYFVIIKFLEFIQNFDIEVIFFFNSGYEYDLSLESLKKYLSNRPEQIDPKLFHKGLNHITIALECREKQQRFRDCANSLKANCQKRIDAIQREINGY